MAKYKNKRDGTVVEPDSELAAQSFEQSKEWTKASEGGKTK